MSRSQNYLYPKISSQIKNDSWKYDQLDDKRFAAKANATTQAERKALSRVNKHKFSNGIHTKTTTLKRGYIGELATHKYFSENSKLLYPVIPIIKTDHKNFSYQQEFIPSISGFQFQEHLLEVEIKYPELWSQKGKDCAEIFVKKLYKQQTIFHEQYESLLQIIKNYINEIEGDEKEFVPICPYRIQANEHIARLIENFIDPKLVDFTMTYLENEINDLSEYLTKNSNSFF